MKFFDLGRYRNLLVFSISKQSGSGRPEEGGGAIREREEKAGEGKEKEAEWGREESKKESREEKDESEDLGVL